MQGKSSMAMGVSSDSSTEPVCCCLLLLTCNVAMSRHMAISRNGLSRECADLGSLLNLTFEHLSNPTDSILIFIEEPQAKISILRCPCGVARYSAACLACQASLRIHILERCLRQRCTESIQNASKLQQLCLTWVLGRSRPLCGSQILYVLPDIRHDDM